MKTGVLKILSIARAAIFSSMLLFSLNGRAQDKTGEVSSLKARPGSKEHLEKYVAEVDHQKAKISSLKETIKHDRKAGRKQTAHAERKNLRHEKADLKSDKKYLMSDSRGIAKGDRSAILQCKKTIREDKINLRESRKALKQARSKNEPALIRSETDHVSFYQQRIEKDKENLSFEKKKKKDDMTFVRRQTKGLRGRRSTLRTI